MQRVEVCELRVAFKNIHDNNRLVQKVNGLTHTRTHSVNNMISKAYFSLPLRNENKIV
jgi:hypothetical protein